jgi:hypothetical protein
LWGPFFPLSLTLYTWFSLCFSGTSPTSILRLCTVPSFLASHPHCACFLMDKVFNAYHEDLSPGQERTSLWLNHPEDNSPMENFCPLQISASFPQECPQGLTTGCRTESGLPSLVTELTASHPLCTAHTLQSTTLFPQTHTQETGFYHVAQADLQLLDSSDPSVSAS